MLYVYYQGFAKAGTTFQQTAIEQIVADARTNIAGGAAAISLIAEDLFRYGAGGAKPECSRLMEMLAAVRAAEGLRMIQVDHANVSSVAQMNISELREINRLDLPDFSQVQETFHQKPLAMKTGQEIAKYLLGCAKGQTTEIVLNGIRSGRVGIGLASGLAIEVKFSKKLFPTLNIWWNNGGCPDEEGCRRVEAAIEPVNGSCSDLVSAHADHTAQLLPPGGKASWKIEWIISR